MSAPWAEIENLFFDALQVPTGEREQWVTAAAAGRPDLAREVLTLLEAHAASEAQPRRIGAYLLERRIGRGGMGEVWLAARADGQFEQRVAIKLVRSGLGADLLLPRFQRERQMLARLNHPHIARLLDGGVTSDGRPYLVMEFVEGSPILDFCDERRLDLLARLDLFRKLCGAVEYAHRNLIVHRDIKPANVLVTADGSPKLLDFGIAKLVENETGATVTAMPLLTPRYASPEQVQGDAVTTASDVYSLGVLLFEMLTGTLPYELRDNRPAEIITAITTREARQASRTHHRVPRGDLDAILSKALEKDPARRYGSVERFSADLENYLEGRPVTARAPTFTYRLGKYLRRHWAGVAAATVAVIALGTAAEVSLRAAHLARLEQTRSERVTRFLEDMLGSVDPGWQGSAPNAGRDVRILDLLPEASARIASVFADDPAAQARLHRVLGRAYTNLQQFPQAEAELKSAMALLPSLDSDPAEKAELLLAAGDLDFRLSHRVEEESELRQALATFETTPALASNPAEHAIYLTALAAALADVGKKQEAGEYADRAADNLRKIPAPSVETGVVHGDLALVFMKLGRLDRARDEGRKAVDQLSLSPKPMNELAASAMWLAIIERSLGNRAAALTAAQRSVEVATQAFGRDHSLTIAPRIELAYSRAEQGEAAQAIPEMEECLKEARAGSSQEDLFHALHASGYVLTLAGRAREAEPLFREALKTGAQFLSPGGPSIGLCNLEFGQCLERLGRRAEARSCYQAAYHNLNAYYGPVYITKLAQQKLLAMQ